MNFSAAAASALLLAAVAATARGQENLSPAADSHLFTPDAQRAADGALRWLKDHQNADGSWSAKIGFKINDAYKLEPPRQGMEGLPHLGVTALAGLAFLSGGNLPGEGPYGDTVSKALDFILAHVQEGGFISANGTRMYSHAFCVLFLAEVYGMTGRPDLRPKLDQAVEFTYKAQNEEGGWRYAPMARDSDMSITVCQVVALREARNIGIRVPKRTIDRALKYVMESAITSGENRGAFRYQNVNVPFNRNSFALTAAGLTTIYQAGLYSDRDVARFCAKNGIGRTPSISDCLEYLERTYGDVAREYREHYFYYYGNYYAIQAMYTRGGAEWRQWYGMVRDDLLQKALRNGQEVHWPSTYVGDNFSTAVAAIILQVPNHYLPIFQR